MSSYTNYCIRVQTGNRKGAGSDANISLTIIGTEGETLPLVLEKWFHNAFWAGHEDKYVMEARDVGELLMIKVENDQSGFFHHSSDLFLDAVLINYEQDPNKVYEFPCYSWVQTESVFFEGKAKLATDTQDHKVSEQRRIEVQQRQDIYHWGDDPDYKGLPGFIKSSRPDELPKDVQFTHEDAAQLLDAKKKGICNALHLKFRSLFQYWKEFEDFCKAFEHLIGYELKAVEHWKSDSYYGAQFLNGSNPDTIKRCMKLPSNFPVTQQMVGNLLDTGDTLQQAMMDGRVYIVDYEILDDVPYYGTLDKKLERRYACPALGLFYVRSDANIVPIAIQLQQVPGKDNPVWTPNDTELDWIYAKMWLRNADAQWHQMITHLLRTHLFMEPIAVATRRQLPSIHPLWKLLSPHLRGTLAINTLGREKLIPAGGIADYSLSIGGGGHAYLMKKHYKSLMWTSYDLPGVLEERGVLDKDKLPGFHYRDDALRLWQIIKEYIADILNIYYHSDKDVEKDVELQAWITDLHDNGYPSDGPEKGHGFPSSVASLEKLIHLLTMIIFTCSCQHAAVNFAQMDTYGFQPHTPSLMRQPPPKTKGQVNMEHIISTLPTVRQVGATLTVLNDLTQKFEDEPHLGEFSERLFTDPAAEEAIALFRDKLNKVSQVIVERNSKLEFPYIYLLPENVTNSVAV